MRICYCSVTWEHVSLGVSENWKGFETTLSFKNLMLQIVVSVERHLASLKVSSSKIRGHGAFEYLGIFEKYTLVIWWIFFEHSMKSIALNEFISEAKNLAVCNDSDLKE